MAGALKNAYLLAYNLAQSAGWFFVLTTIISKYAATSSYSEAASAATPAVLFVQSLALLELVNSLLKIVPGSASSAFMQLFGRNAILFFWLYCSDLANGAVFGMYLTWSISECIRYPFYATSVFDSSPSLLVWMRYSAFAVLYPIGIAFECAVMHTSMPVISNLYPLTVAGANLTPMLSYVYAAYAYGVCGVALYRYMLKQRKKVLGRTKGENNGGDEKKRK